MTSNGRRPQRVPTLWSALRGALSGLVDGFGRLAGANLIWMLLAAVIVLAAAAYPAAAVLGLLLIPASCGLARMAGHAARGRVVRLGHFRDGIRHRCWRHLLLGAGQGLLLGVGLLNVAIGVASGGVLPTVAAVFSGYVALSTWVVATAVWPLLLDPEREALSLRAALRLALAVVATRPLGTFAVALIGAALLAAILQVVLLGFFLPAYGILLTACYVLPVADDITGRGQGCQPRRR